MKGSRIIVVVFFLLLQYRPTVEDIIPQCDKLQFGQFSCREPKIDDDTHEPANCRSSNHVTLFCEVEEGVECVGPRNFTMEQDCRYTSGYKFSIALSLSVFVGLCGCDRFYLGYPAIGLLKLFTLGGFVLGNIFDIIFIATQRLNPADGSNYVVEYSGPVLTRYSVNSATYYEKENTYDD